MSERQHARRAGKPTAASADAEVEALQAEVKGLKEQVLRYAAEAENTKRRAEREMNDARAYAIQKFARDLLGVADILDRAMTARARRHRRSGGEELRRRRRDDRQGAAVGAFERNGLKRIDPAQGEKFDPHQHQAMMEQPDTGRDPRRRGQGPAARLRTAGPPGAPGHGGGGRQGRRRRRRQGRRPIPMAAATDEDAGRLGRYPGLRRLHRQLERTRPQAGRFCLPAGLSRPGIFANVASPLSDRGGVRSRVIRPHV